MRRDKPSSEKLQTLQNVAIDRGGKCLSKAYKNNYSKIEWECEIGHRWKSTPASILGSKNQRGSWCPKCNSRTRSEEICRAIFELIFSAYFPKSRPQWLKNRAHRLPLELDGYNEPLGIAFEYQGPHHYRTIPYYSGSKDHLVNLLARQKSRDRLKQKLCKDRKITLIEVPGRSSHNSIETLGASILKLCRDANLKLPMKVDFSKIDSSSIWTPEGLRKLELARSIALKRKGKCLSTIYFGALTPLQWECKESHIWHAALGKVRSGGWCPTCHFVGRKRTLEDARALAANRNGKCVSKRYILSKDKLEWQCEFGHIWMAAFDKVQSGRWCPECAKKSRGAAQRADIQDMQTLAEKRGGSCISTEYLNSATPLEWECSRGHRWKAVPNGVKRGSWCPICIGKNKTIEDLQRFASAKGGKCVSTQYKNNREHLNWICRSGHNWKASFGNILAGKWCPQCAKKNRGDSQRGNIELMKALASERGGLCLSTTYTNANTILQWRCEIGHEWKATPGHVKFGTWCPRCRGRTAKR